MNTREKTLVKVELLRIPLLDLQTIFDSASEKEIVR